MNREPVTGALRRAMNARCPGWARALLAVLATAVFALLAHGARYAKMDDYASFRLGEILTITTVVFTLVFAASIAVQMRAARTLPLYALLLLACVTGAVLLGKISLLDYVSDDYDIFLSGWIYSYQDMGIREGLGTYIGSDYTPPYLYLMLLISRFKNYPWQYMIKAISMLTEVLMGYAVMRLASLRLKGESAPLLVFHIAQLLPTVVFNGAYWGQCDVIYTSFCLLALYLALTKRPVRSMVCFGVALSFKLQTVFFLPALLPLWLRREVKLRHVLLIPVTYMVMMIPALWGGKSLHHVLTCYLQQAGSYNFITMNGPTLYHLLPASMNGSTLYTMFGGMAMCLGLALLAGACLLVCWRREALTVRSTLLFTQLVVAGVPFFLPKMHERYTFGADVLSLVVAVVEPRLAALPLLFGLASYICYTAGLAGEVVMDLRWATLFQGAGVALTAMALWRSLGGAALTREAATEVKA